MISFSQYILLEGQLEKSLEKLGASEQEAKDAIKRWRNLTDKQKELAPNPQQYQELKTFMNDLESAEKFVSKTAKQKQVKKSGIKGLKEGEDYLEFETGDPSIQAYAPLNWEASKFIASKDVGSCEGKWCTAYQKNSGYWNEYVDVDGGVVIYLVTPETKYGLSYYMGEETGMVGWQLYTHDDDEYDMYDVESEFPEIYPIAEKLSERFEEVRKHLPDSWEEIINKDDVEAFEKKYKGQPIRITSTFMQDAIWKKADKCLEWILKNIEHEDRVKLHLMSTVMLHDENKSERMKNLFMMIYESLPPDKAMEYGFVVDLIENCVLTTQDTDFYFDIILNDDRFYTEPTDTYKGSLGRFERYINNYKVMNTEEERNKLLAKVQKRREEIGE